MVIKARWVCGLAGVLALTACGNDGDSNGGSGGSAGTAAGTGGATSGSSGSAGSGAAGAAGTSGSGAGPAITSAPPEWVRPADCGGIGDGCPEGIFGCGTRSTCQLEGYVCIPALEPGATSLPGRTAETPYCAAYTCMTFEEASCFCTGEAGEVTPSCSSPEALAGLCTGPDGSCADRACCDGLACLDLGTSKRCEAPCTTSADCDTGCCTDLYDTGVSVCAELDACENVCKKRGEACTQGSSTTPDDCCRGACVESENPDYAGCRPTCTTNEQCPETGCCVAFADSTNGFCADARYCSCGAEGATCGPTSSPCCEGTVCAGSENAFTCRQSCEQPSDCASGNCQPLSDSSTSICAAACVTVGEACGVDGAGDCCDGARCAGFDPNYRCYPSCEVDLDCTSGYCSLFDDGSGGICIDDVVIECVAEGSTCGPGTGECCDGLCYAPDLTTNGTCASFCTLPSDCASNCCGDVGFEESSICLPATSCP